jgi:hypothetical protein
MQGHMSPHLLQSGRAYLFFVVFLSKAVYRTRSYWKNRNSSVCIATSYGMDGRGSNPEGVESFCTRPDWLRGPPSLQYSGKRVFPRGKATGVWRSPATQPPTSSAEVKERLELYFYSSSGPSWPVRGWDLLLLYIYAFILMLRNENCTT